MSRQRIKAPVIVWDGPPVHFSARRGNGEAALAALTMRSGVSRWARQRMTIEQVTGQVRETFAYTLRRLQREYINFVNPATDVQHLLLPFGRQTLYVVYGLKRNRRRADRGEFRVLVVVAEELDAARLALFDAPTNEVVT